MGKKYTPPSPPAPKKRVAAYVRVSLETDRLSRSLAAQQEYYIALISARPEWESAGIYADSFISGTETTRRAQFRRLLCDCESGRVDIVLCKSISRFARNTVDLLETVRRLKELGVEVRFEKERISSLSADGELLLTILASFAQEESRSISENVKWGIRRRFQAGTAQMRNKAVFGYRHDGARYVVERGEALVVRLIFSLYISGVPLRAIALRLREMGYKSIRGAEFSHSQIDYIVHNEIYAGSIVLQKTFVRDFITHERAQNRGELPQYRLTDCHEPIIPREDFARAQEESRRRAAAKPAYSLSGRLICACGKPFTRRSNNGKYACWHCRSCLGVKLNEQRLKALLGMSDEEIERRVMKAAVSENGELRVEFFDGGAQTWQYK